MASLFKWISRKMKTASKTQHILRAIAYFSKKNIGINGVRRTVYGG